MRKFLIISTLIFFISCATTDVKILKIRDDFIYNNFSTSKFYITPVLNRTKVPSLDDADIRLEKVFKKEKKNLFVYGADYTLSKLKEGDSPDILSDIKNEYINSSKISNESIINLSKYLGDGYVIFSTLDNFFIRKREYDQSHVVSDGKKGTEFVDEHVTEVNSTIEGSIYIYELKTGKLCFNVDHLKSGINSKSHVERGCFDSCFFSLLDRIFGLGPKPVGANDMAESLFSDAVKSIPNKGDKIEKILGKENRFKLE